MANGFIIYPTYKMDGNRADIYLLGKLESGKSFLSIHPFKPYFYIPAIHTLAAKKLLPQRIAYEESSFVNFHRDSVTKVIAELPKDVPGHRKTLSDEGIPSYEADIRYAMRYLIDHHLKGGITFTEEGEPNADPTIGVDVIFRNPNFSPSTKPIPLKLLSFDIETDMKAQQLYCISFYGETLSKVVMVHNKEVDGAVIVASEPELLNEVVKTIKQYDPDVLIGWNCIDFDLTVLKRKFAQYNIPFRIGRLPWDVNLRIQESFFIDSTADVSGRIVLDGIHLLKSSFIKLPDYKLATAAKHFLGEKKIIEGDNRFLEIERLYKEDPAFLATYNLKDSKLVYDIFNVSRLFDLTVLRSTLTRMPLDRVSSSVASLDSVYLEELAQRKGVAPSANVQEREERITGGYVMTSKPGIYDNILVFDFKSLYPSIIRTFNIDPWSFIPADQRPHFKEKEVIISPNAAWFRKEVGILPELIQQLWQERDAAKKRKDQILSNAIKITMNCFTPDTDILTETGIKKIIEVKNGEKVYSLNPKTHRIELNKVTRTFKYKYSGKMVVIKTAGVDYIVTPNHRFFVKTNKGYKWYEAQQLLLKATKNFWLPKHSPIKGKYVRQFLIKQKCNDLGITYRIKQDKLQKGPKHSSIPSRYSMKDWLQLMGWYLSEGYVYVCAPKRYPGKVSWRGISHRITIGQKQKKQRRLIIELIKRMGLRYAIDISGISVTNQILAEVLLKECGSDSYSKRIPYWVFTLDHSLLKELFKTLMLGDGDKTGDRYSTCNKLLAYDVLRLLHHLGYFGFVYEDKQKYRGQDYIMYRVQINKSRSMQPYISKYRNIHEIDYKGNVYCVEAIPNHTVLAGRNTKLNFCGQSFFGVLANPACRFYSTELANAITFFGQTLIKQCAERLEKENYTIIYGDTDSLFIDVHAPDPQDAMDHARKISAIISAYLEDLIVNQYQQKNYMELEFDKLYNRFLLPKIRDAETGAKKRYAGLLLAEGKEEIEFVGLESVRRDWTGLAKHFQEELVRKVFHREEVTQWIKQYIADIRAGKMDDLLVYRKSIRKLVAAYTKTTPPHIQAARKAGIAQVGIIDYVITTNGPEVVGKTTGRFDYEHYIEKQIKPLAESVLALYGKPFASVVSGHKQANLGDF